MTAEKFIQSFNSHETGDKGFCRLAIMSVQNTNYELGFWFEIEMRDEDAIIFTAKSDSCTKRPYNKTFFISGASRMETLMDKLRQKAQDDLHIFLRHSERHNSYSKFKGHTDKHPLRLKNPITN